MLDSFSILYKNLNSQAQLIVFLPYRYLMSDCTPKGLTNMFSYGIVLPSLHSMATDIDFMKLLKPFSLVFDNKPIFWLWVAMKHPHLWKYFYFEMVKVQSSIHEWNFIMEEAYKFSEFCNTTPQTDKACLLFRSMEKMTLVTEAAHLTATLQKPYISGYFDREGKKEVTTIMKCVQDFVLHITKQVESSNKKLASTPILSGSVVEGTKVGFPDEYDFILHLHELQDEFDKHEEHPKYSLPFRTNFDGSTIFAEYIDAFTTQVLQYQQHMKDFHLLKPPMATSQIKPFSVTLLWNGQCFKYLQVSIDFVPAFKISHQKAQSRLLNLEKTSANSQIFAVFKQNKLKHAHLQLSYSLLERDLLQALPLYVKNGYRLAKAVRHPEVCPNMQLSDRTIASVDEYVTTYMLKTCHLYIIKEQELNHMEDNDWLSPLSIKWAIKIYEQMKFFLENFEGKIPNYFQQTDNICSSCTMPNHMTGRQQQYSKRKQKITLTFIDCILQLLKELLQERLHVRCLIQ